MNKNSGNMLAVFLGILLLVTITFPLVVQLVQTESKQSVNHQKSTVAFQLAEAAVAKGVAKLIENRSNWTNAVAGIPLTGYNNDHEFSDVAGGKYKISFSPGSAPGIVLIVGKGLDASSREVRAIEAEYTGVDPDGAALIFSKGQAASGANTHWGSVKSWGNLKHFNDFGWPRLLASGSISNRDTDPAPPNTNNTEYWAYRTDMGSAPIPDYSYYKEKAMNSVVPSSSTTGEIRHPDGSPVDRSPVNSGLFSSALQNGKNMIFDKLSALPEGMGNLYEFRSSTSVLYFDFTNQSQPSYAFFYRTFLDVEAVIVPLCCASVVNSSVPYMVYGATIPATAPDHYQGNTVWHGGFPSGQQYWATNFSAVFAQPSHCCYNITNPQIRGYTLMTNFSVSRAVFLGVVQEIAGSGSWSTNSQVYYDPAVLDNIVWAQVPLYRRSWKESRRSWE